MGALASARQRLSALARQRPESVALAILLQEVQLALGKSLDELRVDYRLKAAREDESPASLVLAARVESDSASAKALLERALELDPSYVWAHYALAHWHARAGEWQTGRVFLERALELDPGHMPARRLEAAMLARNGQRSAAEAALERWIDVSQDDALVDPRARVATQLDLALLWVLDGKHARARELLGSLADSPYESLRRECLLAGAAHAEGDLDLALAAARRGEAAHAREQGEPPALSLVQQAVILEEQGEGDLSRAEWERVVAAASSKSDLAALIQAMRARVVLERWERSPRRAP